MSAFPVDARRRVDDFLRRNGFQQYKILLLVAAGAVFRNDGEQAVRPIKSEDEMVEDGDVVLVTETNPVFVKSINDLKPSDFRDYVFSVDRDQWFKSMADIVSLRGDNIRLDAATSFTGFVKALNADRKVTNPVRNLFVVSHASDEGYLFTALDAVDVKSISFEDLEKVGSGLQIKPEALMPRPKDQGSGTRPFLHIRGCEIGRAAPYMIKLKAALGGNLTITAPLFYHVVDSIASPPGRIEYFLYHFTVAAAAPYRKRADLVEAFKNKPAFTDLDGKSIPAANWDDWVPASGLTQPSHIVFSLAVSPVDNRKTKVKGYFKYRLRPFLKDSLAHFPASLRSEAKRVEWLIDQVRKWPIMSPTHPFPAYVRYGYKSFDDFAAGWKWRVEPTGDQFKINVFRHEYDVLPPVVETSTRKLLLNFFSARGVKKPLKPIILLPDGDPRFFGVY
jgi:hypothetical protein